MNHTWVTLLPDMYTGVKKYQATDEYGGLHNIVEMTPEVPLTTYRGVCSCGVETLFTDIEEGALIICPGKILVKGKENDL